MNARYGITLLSLVITIVILLLLVGVTISTFYNGNIIENTESTAEQSKIAAKKTEIELAIIKTKSKNDGEVTIENIIEELEKQGIINKEDGNPDNGQVKTQPDEYIFEIKEDEKGNWEIEYIGKGEIEKAEITISVTANTTSLTDKVILTITAKAEDGIKSFTGEVGDNKTYISGTKEIEEVCEITKNGTYTFTVENNNGKTAIKEITISNILEGTIQLSAEPTVPTKNSVEVTVTWPSGSERGIKEIKVGNSEWKIVTGETSIVEVRQNCKVEARIRNSVGEVTASSLTITNIDKLKPTVTVVAGAETIKEGDSNEISKYFTYEANGTAEISSVTYTDTSDENKTVTNTNTLSVGTHIIKCTVTKETGLSTSAIKTIIVEQAGLPSIRTATDINESTTAYQDENGNKVVVPGGFKVVTELGTLVEEGIVIEDSEGNQFVWIPVGTITKKDGSTVTIDLGRYTFDATTGETAMQQSAENYEQEVAIETNFKELATSSESDGSQTNTTSYSLQKWINSALVNGGYYIARYEASFGSGEASSTITNQEPQFKQSVNKADTMTYTQGTLWNNITQADASKVCRNMYYGNEYNGKDYVESDLINSYAWDTAIAYIQKCSNNSNYANKTDESGAINNTGETGDVLCNIYDMAANLGEWTTEFSAYSNSGGCNTTYYPSTYRGATYTLNTNSTAKRNYSERSNLTSGIGFRSTLAITVEVPKIVLSTTKWTTEDVIVTVEWPTNTDGLTKQIKIGDNEWKEYAGEETVGENCTVRARMLDENGEAYGVAVSVTITNIVAVAEVAIVEKPVIMEGMTAVYWSTDGGKTASTTEEGASPIYSKIDSDGEPSSTGTVNSNFNWDNWYEYIGGDNSTDTRISRWANAITDDGSYWVWIPRFKYKISEQPTEAGEDNAGKIDVKFISTTEKMGTSGYTTAANADGEILTTDSDGYIIHPAFENGSSTGKNNGFANGEWDSELPGFWIAKYEMSGEDASGGNITPGNVALSSTVKMVSKPNLSSWDEIQIGQAYQNCLNYDTAKNSHLIKNSEWGAVTYLAHSQYGRNRSKVVNNSNNSYITGGFSEGVLQSTYKYNQEIAMKTSTTGNIYGVYDMGTGGREYIAGWDTKATSSNVTDYGKAVDGTVYFSKGELSDRTKTAYSNGTEASDNEETIKGVSRIGEGLEELYGWFDATIYCVDNSTPFSARGGEFVDGLNDGNFSSYGSSGDSSTIISFRVILSGEM